MKFILPLFLICFSFSFSQTQKVRAYLDEKQFCAPEIGNYIEIQLQFVGYSFKYKNVEGGLKGELAVRLDIKSNDSIVAKDAYRLQTPLMKDSIIDDFYDIRRFALVPGNYVLEVELQDLNAEGESVKASKPFVIEEMKNALSISDIQISEVITKGDNSSVFFKSGYNMIPNLSTFYPSEISKLPVYFEIYNSNLIGDSVFALKQTITDVLSDKIIEDFTLLTRHKSSEIIPILRPIDISNLQTGKYTLNFSLLNRSLKEVMVKSFEFERSNNIEKTFNPDVLLIDPAFQASITDDSVDYYLASLIPMSRSSEVKSILTILKSKNKESARKHIQGFWNVTANFNSYEAWMKYKAQVQVVERLYGNNFQAGYETDRGRVYLQYGSPTTVLQKEVSSTEYPYEIWQYNKIGKFSNKRFIFYNPDLVNNAYRLLHSDMIGELKNASWQLVLNKRNTTNGTIDNPNQNVEQNYGGNSNANFRQY
jgi:GWxTD domain-containing protein